ncbi:MAG: glycosyltransferase family 4 protein [Candidatus Krumholzibacteriota bacterium]|nr:glycosyltransferase family 4 protein [Candidatus Krumholzibacteriota bacterium]
MKIGLYALWNLRWDGEAVTGLGTHVRYLRHFLAHTGGVRLFTNVQSGEDPVNTERLADPRLEIVPLPWCSFPAMWRHLSGLRRIFAANLDGLDAMYVRLFDPCPWLLARLCEARRMGMLFHAVGNPIEGIALRPDWSAAGKLARRVLFEPEWRLALRAARRHRLLANGRPLADFLTARGLSAEAVITSTLAPEDFHEREETCSGPEPVILFVGFLRPAKRVDRLLEAVAILHDEGRRTRLRVVGGPADSRHRRELARRAEALGLAGRVVFAGEVPLGEALNREYRGADLFALPSATEGSPRALLEAAANGLPLVTTDVGSARELFTDGESALIVPPDNAPALAHALGRLLDDGALRRRCLRAARDVARAHMGADFIRGVVERLAAERELALRG